MYIGQIGLIALSISVILLVAQIVEAGAYINKEDKTRYRIISLKSKASRTFDEENFMKENWAKYYVSKIRNISFMIGLSLVVGTLIFNYVTK